MSWYCALDPFINIFILCIHIMSCRSITEEASRPDKNRGSLCYGHAVCVSCCSHNPVHDVVMHCIALNCDIFIMMISYFKVVVDNPVLNSIIISWTQGNCNLFLVNWNCDFYFFITYNILWHFLTLSHPHTLVTMYSPMGKWSGHLSVNPYHHIMLSITFVTLLAKSNWIKVNSNFT